MMLSSSLSTIYSYTQALDVGMWTASHVFFNSLIPGEWNRWYQLDRNLDVGMDLIWTYWQSIE
jgi:hypothetical protein